MNKTDLVENVALKAGIPRTRAAAYLQLVVEEISGALSHGEKVTISGFGSFSVSTRKPFLGHNPKTGEAIQIPERKNPVFRAGRELKTTLNKNSGPSKKVKGGKAEAPAKGGGKSAPAKGKK